ncbi:hypothetical protein [Arthrospiribacter ruber]|uniref:DUF4221 domain-containing protein n=1 Tax=Arthrospiribacter ruber TaxID=2487934 RepID=A0A951MIP0_9BACT|nr:hypothetical protein [Arthrospiribacter ruber]MBW3469911.1 hypothetical protein [Arthrospiribacter ruber]
MKFYTYYLSLLLSGTLFMSGCDSAKTDLPINPHAEIELELFDSLVVEEFSIMYINDINLQYGKALIVDKNKNLFLTDLKGQIIQSFELANDGPNGVGSTGAQGYKFLDDKRFVAQGFLNGYFVYDLEGNQMIKAPYNTDNLFRITLYRGRTTFHPYLENGQIMVLGEELNFFTNEEMDPKVHGLNIYEEVSGVFRYNLETTENELLETFPPTWEPRVTQRYVGNRMSFVALHDSKESYALLPQAGSQLFIYDMGNKNKLRETIELSHPKRPEVFPSISMDDSNEIENHPVFSNLLYAGEYALVQFFTKIPEDQLKAFKAKSEQYFNLPEYKEAFRKYVKPYYILVKNGQQIGVINELPVNGNIEFLDKEGAIYINDNISPEVERDYNVFYKLKIKE